MLKMRDREGAEYTIEKIENLRGSALRLNVQKTDGSSKPFVITYNPTAYNDSAHVGWSCGCRGWIFQRKCRHLDMIASEMKTLTGR